MGYVLGCTLSSGETVAASVGNNGSQLIMMGLWFAAYAVSGRSESKRVCAWVDSRWPGVGNPKLHPDAPRSERNRPGTVVGLIAFNYTEDANTCTAICPQASTIKLGLKFKPAEDAMLARIVELWQRVESEAHDELPTDLTARLADDFAVLLPCLTPSCWHPVMAEIAHVFRVAADAGVGVRV